jgi:hypothetical protein
VDHGPDVAALGHDLGVDRVLDVPTAGAVQYVAVGRNQDDPVRLQFLEAPAGALHPRAAPAGVAYGAVPPDQVRLPGRPQRPAARSDQCCHVS